MRIIKSERVHAYCQKHQRTTEHMEYFKEDGSYVYKCLECYKERPYNYPVYGRQSPKLELERPKNQQIGRVVA